MIGGLLLICLIIFFLLLPPYLIYLARRSWRKLDELELKDRFAARNDFIKTTAQILAGAFFLATIYFTYQNLAVSQKNLAAIQEKNVTDLYIKAIEQLGSDKLEVRLGGIYALERIARESPKDNWAIMEVLTAYVRENAPWPPEELAVARKKRPWAKPKDTEIPPLVKAKPYDKREAPIKPDPDIQAVLTVLGRTARPFAQEQEGELGIMDLRATNLAGSDLMEADLQETLLLDANLRKAKLWKANLQGAVLWEANLLAASLRDSNLQEADLRGANLFQAHLQDASLFQANLQGADFRGARGLTAEQVKEAYWDETTKWPEGFVPPAPRRAPPESAEEGRKAGQ